MADRAEPDITRGPEDSAEAEVLQDAETRSTPEISVPILDVHAPHGTIHTWKGFLIHIATISLGLLIAIGLERTVELFHHRHQRQQLAVDLQREGLRNREIVERDLTYLDASSAWLVDANQAVRVAKAGRGQSPMPDQSA
jgi:hypothetical protein